MVFSWKRQKATGEAPKNNTEALLARGENLGDYRTAIATARWLRGDTLEKAASDPANELYYSTNLQGARPDDSGSIYVGSVNDDGVTPLGWSDDRHLITVAGSRAGKGVSAILPNLHLYPGSIICMDPKGENASKTANHRAEELGQDVFVLDPYDVTTGVDPRLKTAYDPLAGLKPEDPEIIEKISLIADAIVVPAEDSKDPHFDEVSRTFITALIGHLLTNPRSGAKNLVTMRQMLLRGDPDYAAQLQEDEDEEYERRLADGEDVTRVTFSAHDGLYESMLQSNALDGLVSGFAQRLADMGVEERGSVLSSADRHTRFIDGKMMASVLISTAVKKRLDLRKLKTGSKPMTIYLCLPTRYFSTHSRWLRLMLNSVMAAVEHDPTGVKPGQYRILAILDEFPVLRYMSAIESAIGFMAGYGIILWAILQDLSQLKRDYPKSWETFLGNAGMKQFFGNTDHTTLEYISKSLGETEVVRKVDTTSAMSKADREAHRRGAGSSPQDSEGFFDSTQTADQIMKTPLLAPHEVARVFQRKQRRQLILSNEFRPIVAYRRAYHKMITSGELDDLKNRS